MATHNFTSRATQAEVVLPETGIVTWVAVNGQPWAYSQSGPFDLSVDFAPSIPAGRSVVITYMPVLVEQGAATVDAATLMAALSTKQNALVQGDGIVLNGATISVVGIDRKADAAWVTQQLLAKADAEPVQNALNSKASLSYVDNRIALLQAILDSMVQSGAGPSLPTQTYVEAGYFAQDYVLG